MVLLRVDDFTDLNDALGHAHGDDMLAAIGARLRELVREWTVPVPPRRAELGEGGGRHLLAHLGGEQFVLVVTGTDADEMRKIAERARQVLRTVVLPSVDGYELRIRTSAGIVEGSAGSRTGPDAWLCDAHRALAWAHRDQRGAVVFDERRAGQDIVRHRLAAAMPAALERGEFEPYFQPIVRMSEGAVIGVEALARWWRPGIGLVNPQEFITPAEKTGLIVPLDRTMLEQACRQGAAWRRQGHDLLISANVSGFHLGDPGLTAVVTALLDDTGLPAESLQLEITESADVDQHLAVLAELDEMDIRLALDDFGTGYAGLASLSALPVTTVKLAAKLVRALDDPDDAAAAAVVKHMIKLCHELNITVVAEGVETERQDEQLNRMGCDYGQGFLYGRPDPADVVTRRRL
ncbi:putative bifunctional diguanylate cyclase/phosphodiesterase [Actinoplanes utahensis]|uniref:Diguanylate cyclase n=1 Tax=Actinoplanes utahensis TaxID=1869 RepID=A0A0A6UT01_ACTUT|nr:bifunctional diguanylate cyclase/phosphodiesterase [Actinoplanes utahensis]KHD78123.1 hypothetical protein MB27_06530 [Actinoplanes utahensis]GIF30603.1 hypothetical protein Aut01nite_35890 [Actinoplanes utahensis]